MDPRLYVEMLAGEPRRSLDEYDRAVARNATDWDTWYMLHLTFGIIEDELRIVDPVLEARFKRAERDVYQRLQTIPNPEAKDA